MTMKKVNIFEAKARLSDFVSAVERGERVIICRRNRPVAELRPIEPTRTAPRPVGGAKGRLVLPASFFDPLPGALLDAFSGESPGASTGALRVAESSPADQPSPGSRTRRPRR